ncbi:hypothetical protein CYMTET_13097, partial [Cymbomonas tetramitiformis]
AVVEFEGKFGPTTTEIVAALKEMGKEPLPEYPSKELKSLILRDLLEGDMEETEDTGDKVAPAPSSIKDKGVEDGKGKGKVVDGEVEEEDEGEAEAQAQATIAGYAYVQQEVATLEIGDIVCLMTCGERWEVEAEEKRWEAHTSGDGFEETVLEAHWTLLDPDLLPHATAAMQAIATETAEKLGVQASVSDPGVVADLHKGVVAAGEICVPQQFCLHRFVVDETTTNKRDVDLPFYFSGAPAEWVKKAEKIGKK